MSSRINREKLRLTPEEIEEVNNFREVADAQLDKALRLLSDCEAPVLSATEANEWLINYLGYRKDLSDYGELQRLAQYQSDTIYFNSHEIKSVEEAKEEVAEAVFRDIDNEHNQWELDDVQQWERYYGEIIKLTSKYLSVDKGD